MTATMVPAHFDTRGERGLFETVTRLAHLYYQP